MRERRAWDDFQSGNEPTGVPDQLLDSWRRSRWSGVDPGEVEIPQIDVDDDSAFVRAAAPVLLDMADLLVGTSTCLALADPRGDILWRWTSEPTLARALDRVRVQRGSRLGEERVGTNGIGTALESRRLATVFGPDHYVEAFHRWACVAAPVFHPISRRVCGAVNLTCRAEDANQFLRVAARSLVEGVTHALALTSSAAERRLLDAFLTGRTRTTAPILTLNDQMMIVDETADGWGLDHGAVWARVHDSAPGGSEVVLRAGLRARIWPITDGTLDDGALLVLHPDAAAPAPAPAPGPGGSLGPLEHAEAEVIAAVLADCGGNKSAAAARLGISRGTLYQKLRRYRLTAVPTAGARRPL